MRKSALFPIVGLLLALPAASPAQTALARAAEALGVDALGSIQYSGAGSIYGVGQSDSPGKPGPRFDLTAYTVAVDYTTPSWRQEIARSQAEVPPRAGSGPPMIGELRQVQLVSGDAAWDLEGETVTAAPSSVAERTQEIWITPHGFVKAAMTNKATSRPHGKRGTGHPRKSTRVSFTVEGHKYRGVIDAAGLVEKVETWVNRPALGDIFVETTYSGYKDFAGVKFPTGMVQTRGGHLAFSVRVTSVQPNAPVKIDVPQSVRGATAPPARTPTP